jgi:ribosomal protein S18 acetylase RimI-like enzyme
MDGWRLASPADDEALVAMFIAFNGEDPGQLPVAPAHMRRTLTALRSEPQRGRALVLELSALPLGYALLIPFWSNEIGGECCVVDEIYVGPEARGRGYASALFSALRRPGPLWPSATVALVLEVSPKNRRAYALYRKLGFRGENLSMRLLGDVPSGTARRRD